MGAYRKQHIGYELSFTDSEHHITVYTDRVSEIRYQDFIANVKELLNKHNRNENATYITNHSFLLRVDGTIKGYGDDRLQLQVVERDGIKLKVIGPHRYTPDGSLAHVVVYVPIEDVLEGELDAVAEPEPTVPTCTITPTGYGIVFINDVNTIYMHCLGSDGVDNLIKLAHDLVKAADPEGVVYITTQYGYVLDGVHRTGEKDLELQYCDPDHVFVVGDITLKVAIKDIRISSASKGV